MTTKRPASVSIIVPAFNDQSGVLRLLSAIREQTYPPERIETIIVDNGSNPPLRLDHPDGLSLRLLSCTKPGSYAARNVGARFATGEHFFFTDADCIPDKDWVRNGVRAIQDAPRSIIGGDVRMLAPEKRTATSDYQVITGFQQASNVADKKFSVTANLICTSDTFSLIGPFDEDLLSGGDREWGWRANRMGIDTRYCDEAIVGTHPRSTIAGAIRQARRVAAGRVYLESMNLAGNDQSFIRPHRGAASSIAWIIKHKDLSIARRFKVLVVASLIRCVSMLESIRVSLGGKAERR